MNSEPFEYQVLENIPNPQIDSIIEQAKNSPRYISHEIIPDGSNTSTLKIKVKISG